MDDVFVKSKVFGYQPYTVGSVCINGDVVCTFSFWGSKWKLMGMPFLENDAIFVMQLLSEERKVLSNSLGSGCGSWKILVYLTEYNYYVSVCENVILPDNLFLPFYSFTLWSRVAILAA